MNSRKVEDLHPYLVKRWNMAYLEWLKEYPNRPVPFLTATYRSWDVQQSLYDQGRTTPGKVVTFAKPGQSLHNYYPSYAFDAAFKVGDEVDWSEDNFHLFAAIIKPMGVEWGGDFPPIILNGKLISRRDTPHFQVPNFTWHDAEAGKKFNAPD